MGQIESGLAWRKGVCSSRNACGIAVKHYKVEQARFECTHQDICPLISPHALRICKPAQCLRNKDALVRERTAGHGHSLPRNEPPHRADGVRRVTPPPTPPVASEIRGINGCCFKPHAVKVVYLFVTSDVTTHPFELRINNLG
ncbi:unnamed protein product [Pleuronectes platessa]|uniref:Uncharacterized protein n=1 Tax=Pleuronectes platessa TaxID=8262 RepID=A0A9N7VZ37_PLEPL|nr:unnamed protein product [Pleuronectes platessa]